MTDSIVINSPSTSEEPEGHEQAMVDLVDKHAEPPAVEVAPVEEPERPAWLPEKFKSAEDMAKAYGELETKIGAKPVQGEVTPETPVEATEATPEAATEALATKGLDLQEFSTEFGTTGELSAKSYERLEAAGYPQDIVNQYIEGQKARASQFESSIKNEIGGEARYAEVSQWAAATLTAGELDAYNKAVTSGSLDHAKLAINGLANRYTNENGSDPKRTIGGTSKASSEETYKSTAQLTQAMRDPRYKTDAAYRASVQNKLANSNVF
jgi:hypothetical protein